MITYEIESAKLWKQTIYLVSKISDTWDTQSVEPIAIFYDTESANKYINMVENYIGQNVQKEVSAKRIVFDMSQNLWSADIQNVSGEEIIRSTFMVLNLILVTAQRVLGNKDALFALQKAWVEKIRNWMHGKRDYGAEYQMEMKR